MRNAHKKGATLSLSRLEQLSKLEKDLGVIFFNKSLLNQVFLHPSFTGENGLPHHDSNQRLEFLGDSVIYVITASLLYNDYPYESEGKLTEKRIKLIREETLAKAASFYHLDKYLMLSHGGSLTKINTLPSTLSDTFEALLGAMFLDKGVEETTKFVISTLRSINVEF